MTTTRPTVWILAALSAAALATPARATVFLCAHRNANGDAGDGASVKVRSVCRDNEVALDPASLGIRPRVGAVTIRTGNTITTNGSLSTPANCEPGEVATGGGVLSVGNDGGQPVMRSSRPQPDTAGATPTSWRVTVANVAGTGTVTATAYAVCAEQ